MSKVLETAPTNVTVYTDRARVVRRGKVTLEPGSQLLEIPDLPLQLKVESLRAAARGSAKARLLGVQAQRTFFIETPVEQIRELEQQIEALEDEISALNDRTGLVKQNRVAIDSIFEHTDTYATALAVGETSLEAQLALFDGLRARAEQLDTELQTIAAGKRGLERRLAKLNSELENWRGTPRREQYTATVEVEVLEAGDLDVELSYVVMGAGWQPLYDLRLLGEEDSEPRLEVGYLAQVKQRTGEAWQDVKLSLSTARPALSARLPELQPWYVQPLPPPEPMPKAPYEPAAPAMREARFVADAARPPEPVEAEMVTASVDASSAALTYHVPVAVSIPADGAPHKVTVTRLQLAPGMDYTTAPRLVEAVYRRAQVTNDSPYTLLPGIANLFAGDEFIGSMQLELVAPQETLELFLGVDDRLQVKRELKRREVDKRLIGGKRQVHYGYEISLENLLSGEAKIALQDQIPVSKHEEIKVRLESANPNPTEQSELNILTWNFTLASKEKRVVRFDFLVEHPREMDVVGLL